MLPHGLAEVDRAKAAAIFVILTGINCYSVLYRIETVKRTDIRTLKIAEFVTMLEFGQTIQL